MSVRAAKEKKVSLSLPLLAQSKNDGDSWTPTLTLFWYLRDHRPVRLLLIGGAIGLVLVYASSLAWTDVWQGTRGPKVSRELSRTARK